MTITEKQKEVFGKFTCKRISELMDYQSGIKNFQNELGSNMIENLQQSGMSDDINGKNAIYLIYDPNGVVCCFFALRCGIMFQPFNVEAATEKVHQYQKDLQEWRNGNLTLPILKRAKKMNYSETKSYKILRYKNDVEMEGNVDVYRVAVSYPAVELSQFCVNDAYRNQWNAQGFDQKMGVTLFYYFVAEKIIQLGTLAGCQKVYLFAAEDPNKKKLVDYYEKHLYFSRPTVGLGAVKESYDYSALLMEQDITKLKEQRETIFS